LGVSNEDIILFVRFFIALFAWSWLSLSVQAADIHNFDLPIPNGDIVINFNGQIIEGDYQKLVALVEGSQISNNVLIAFDSPGGSIKEAIAIGRYIRSQGFETFIADECYSACFFSFIGGVKREALGKLGVHQFYGGRGNADYVESTTQLLTAELMEYTASMGVDIETLKIAFQTPPQDMYIFSKEEIERFGIDTIQTVGQPLPEGVLWQKFGWEVVLRSQRFMDIPGSETNQCVMRKYTPQNRTFGIVVGEEIRQWSLFGEIGMIPPKIQDKYRKAGTFGKFNLLLLFDGHHYQKVEAFFDTYSDSSRSFISFWVGGDVWENFYHRNTMSLIVDGKVIDTIGLKGSAKALHSLVICDTVLRH